MFKVVSLFCGCGGADLGIIGGFNYLNSFYQTNGCSIVHASDINKKAIATYNENFDHKAVVQDINSLSLMLNDIDLVVGGFPCQPFSSVNPTKNPDKKESQLFWEMARIIDETKPKAFIAENVKGFYRLKKGYYFDLACNEFASLGYNISHKLINSSDFGVPQKRERIFIIGIRKDLGLNYVFPNSTHGTIKTPKTTLNDVIDSLWPKDEKYFFSKKAVDGVKNTKTKMRKAIAQKLDSQCLTITCHLSKASINSTDPILLVSAEKELYRRFTPLEAARIQSFPDSFTFSCSDNLAYQQIGNAIPPVVMWHLVKQLKSLINSKQNNAIAPIHNNQQKTLF